MTWHFERRKSCPRQKVHRFKTEQSICWFLGLFWGYIAGQSGIHKLISILILFTRHNVLPMPKRNMSACRGLWIRNCQQIIGEDVKKLQEKVILLSKTDCKQMYLILILIGVTFTFLFSIRRVNFWSCIWYLEYSSSYCRWGILQIGKVSNTWLSHSDLLILVCTGMALNTQYWGCS